jgi:N-methylhydantoinase A/oxoprolinase/acetone carboxylase beta subunit
LMVPPVERPAGGDGGAGLGRRLLRQALSPEVAAASPEIEVAVQLKRPLIALGAPAGLHFPGLAASLGAQLVLPEHAAVANAVGAVAGGVVERAIVTVTAPAEDRFRVHAASGPRDFGGVEAALAWAEEVAVAAACARARRAGAERIETRVQREVRTATLAGGRPLFVEATVTAIAAGRPRRAAG